MADLPAMAPADTGCAWFDLPGGAGRGRVVPAFVAEVTCESADRRTPVRATLLACDDPQSLGFAAAPGPLGRDALAVNGELAAALGAVPGAAVVLRLAKVGDVPADSPLGRRTGDSWSRRLRLETVLPAEGISQFALKPAQVTAPLAVVSLATMEALLRRDEPPANALLLVGDPRPADAGPASRPPASSPWKKSSGRFSTDENLRFSRTLRRCLWESLRLSWELRSRHVIPDVPQAVYPQPAIVSVRGGAGRGPLAANTRRRSRCGDRSGRHPCRRVRARRPSWRP